MTLQIPFPYLPSLPPGDREMLRRNFEAVGQQITSGATGYDATVIPGLAADNPSALQFKTVFSAVKYIADTLGVVSMTIGVLHATSTITETANYGGTTSNLTVRVVSVGNNEALPTSPANAVVWNLAGFTDPSGRIRVLFTDGIAMQASTVGSTPVLGTAAGTTNVIIINGSFTGNATSGGITRLVGTGGSITLIKSQIDFTQHAHAALIAYDSRILVCGDTLSGTTGSWTANLYLFDTQFDFHSGAGSLTITLSAGQIVVDGGDPYAETNGTQITWAITSANIVHWSSGVPNATASFAPTGDNLTITSTLLRHLYVEGVFRSITTPALAATAISTPVIQATVTLQADITGPAVVDLVAGSPNATLSTYGIRLRGKAISGSVAAYFLDGASTGTVLDVIGLTRSVVGASIVRSGGLGAGSVKAYNIDVASANNVLTIEADAFNGGTGSNASASTLVITDAGFAPSGTAGGSLANSYPNPIFAGRDSSVDKINQDLLPSLLSEGAGVTTFPAQAPGSAPTGPAAGALASTYPNPIFAGRDNSVDQINRDLLPAALMESMGVTTFPAPATGGSTLTIDDITKTLVPPAHGPEFGIFSYPDVLAPTGGGVAGVDNNTVFTALHLRGHMAALRNQQQLPHVY